ncbi:hypothetical protein [uncultured Lactobacillus sp.]|uniref:hypothetical protein n=1 Tax=uncultured Lactobacillus sp. TaxID=153152 RepID=UPI0026245E66|nr:hypothetical protein [uncultured Lactobacillus sp.]
MKTISEWLPWAAMVVMYVAGKIASYYEYSKKNDPEIAGKLKHIGELAKWAVANQERYDKPGTSKFEDAVKSVESQVKDQGVDTATIKGAVQYEYEQTHKSKPEPIEIPKVTTPSPVHDEDAVLDNLEVK